MEERVLLIIRSEGKSGEVAAVMNNGGLWFWDLGRVCGVF